MPNIMAARWGHLYKGTPAELSLETAVAALGVPYRTQFPGFLYGFRFFPDFVLPTLGLIIEVDDSSHSRAEKIEADADRTAALNDLGFAVVRCTNKEALDDPDGAVRAMLASVSMWPIPRNLPSVAASLPRVQKASRRARRTEKTEKRQARRSPSDS